MCGVCCLYSEAVVCCNNWFDTYLFNAKKKLSAFLCYLYYVHLKVFFYSLRLDKTEVYVVKDGGMTGNARTWTVSEQNRIQMNL